MPPVYYHPIETSREAKARYHRTQRRFYFGALEKQKATRRLELEDRDKNLREQKGNRKERRQRREAQKALRLQQTPAALTSVSMLGTLAIPQGQLPSSDFFSQPVTGGIRALPSEQHSQPVQLFSSPDLPPDLPWYVESRQSSSPPSSPPLPSLQTIFARRAAPTSTPIAAVEASSAHHLRRSSSPAHNDLTPDSPRSDCTIPLSSLPRSDHGPRESPDRSVGAVQIHDDLDVYLPCTPSVGGLEDKDSLPGLQSLVPVHHKRSERSFTGPGWQKQQWSQEEEPPAAASNNYPPSNAPDSYSPHEIFSERRASSFNSEELMWERESSATDSDGLPLEPDTSLVHNDPTWLGHQAQLAEDGEQANQEEEYPLSLSATVAFNALFGETGI